MDGSLAPAFDETLWPEDDGGDDEIMDAATIRLRDAILQILRRAARNREETPTNVALAELTGAVRQSTARLVRALERHGAFIMEVRGNERRIRFSDGTETTWGHFRRGHIPGCAVNPPRIKRLQSPPRPPIVVGPARSCQFPLWADDARPGADPQFCGSPPAQPGMSWCAGHCAVVFVEWPSPRRSLRERLLDSTSLCSSSGGGET